MLVAFAISKNGNTKRETTKQISFALIYPSANLFQQSFLIYATANDIISRLQCCVFKE